MYWIDTYISYKRYKLSIQAGEDLLGASGVDFEEVRVTMDVDTRVRLPMTILDVGASLCRRR